MNNKSFFPERLQRALNPGHDGVAGIVDDLLELCREQGLQLVWHDHQCQVRSLETASQEAIPVALPKAVFRALLARIAALCNEHSPNSVSPYGGEGELAVETSPVAVFRITFVNTPEEQRLEVRHVGDDHHGSQNPLSSDTTAVELPRAGSVRNWSNLLSFVIDSLFLWW